MTLTLIDVETYGLYHDGIGMSVHANIVWRDYWEHYNKIFWHPVLEDDAVYLAAVFGGGMIHPERFRIPLMERKDSAHLAVKELSEAFEELSRKLGFSFQVRVMEAKDSDNGKFEEFATERGVL